MDFILGDITTLSHQALMVYLRTSGAKEKSVRQIIKEMAEVIGNMPPKIRKRLEAIYCIKLRKYPLRLVMKARVAIRFAQGAVAGQIGDEGRGGGIPAVLKRNRKMGLERIEMAAYNAPTHPDRALLAIAVDSSMLHRPEEAWELLRETYNAAIACSRVQIIMTHLEELEVSVTVRRHNGPYSWNWDFHSLVYSNLDSYNRVLVPVEELPKKIQPHRLVRVRGVPQHSKWPRSKIFGDIGPDSVDCLYVTKGTMPVFGSTKEATTAAEAIRKEWADYQRANRNTMFDHVMLLQHPMEGWNEGCRGTEWAFKKMIEKTLKLMRTDLYRQRPDWYGWIGTGDEGEGTLSDTSEIHIWGGYRLVCPDGGPTERGGEGNDGEVH